MTIGTRPLMPTRQSTIVATGPFIAVRDLHTEFFYGISAEAKARRDKAMPLINDDPSRVPDYVFSGPELPLDEGVKARLFGEA
jgi:hypothetical protein